MRDWLKKAREKSGLTQQDVSKKLCISRQYYNQIETGIRQLKMDITLVSKLSVILNVPLEQVIENEKHFFKEVETVRKLSKTESEENL